MDDRRIYDFYIAGRSSAALAAAVRLGLFDELAYSPMTEEVLALRLSVKPRPLHLLLTALHAMGLVGPSNAGWKLSEDAAAFLVRGKPGWLGGLIELEVEHFLSPALLLEALHRDSSSVYGDQDPWQRHAEDLPQARAFTQAMHSISERPAAGLAHGVDLSGARRLLDVGGGSGVYSIALCRAWPDLTCTLLELPSVCELAREYVAEAGLSQRIILHPADMFAEAWPGHFDAVLFSQILHDWPPPVCAKLLQRAAAALNPDGAVYIHEKLVDDDGAGPLANALVNLDMLVWTEGQQWTEGELRELLRQSGFARVERQPTVGYWSCVTAWCEGGVTEIPPPAV